MPAVAAITMEVLKAVRSSKPDVEVIMVTGYPMIESAVEAMRLGAFHYLAKPYSLEEARMLVARALEKRRLRQQVAQMRAQLEASGSVPEMVGISPAMCGLRQALMRVHSLHKSLAILAGKQKCIECSMRPKAETDIFLASEQKTFLATRPARPEARSEWTK